MCCHAAIIGTMVYMKKFMLALVVHYLILRTLQKSPFLIHEPRRKYKPVLKSANMKCVLAAHRGGSWETPENTLQAFKNAIKLGCRVLECDVRITKDKQLIVCHDEDHQRLCGDPRKVCETTLAELPKFKKEMPMHFSKLSDKGNFQTYSRKDGDDDTYCTLEEVFKIIPKTVSMNIEIKDDSEEAAKAMIALIKKYDRYSTTATGGEENHKTERVLALDPKIATFCSKSDVIKIILFTFFGLLPYLTIDRDTAMLPYMT